MEVIELKYKDNGTVEVLVENEGMVEMNAKLISDAIKNKQEIDDLKKQIEHLHNVVMGRDKIIVERGEAVRNLQKENSELAAKNIRLKNKLEKYESESESDNESDNNEVMQLKKQIEQLRKDIDLEPVSVFCGLCNMRYMCPKDHPRYKKFKDISIEFYYKGKMMKICENCAIHINNNPDTLRLINSGQTLHKIYSEFRNKAQVGVILDSSFKQNIWRVHTHDGIHYQYDMINFEFPKHNLLYPNNP